MKQNAFRAWGVALSLLLFTAGSVQRDGLNLLVEQIRALGTRQWLGLMAGSMVPDALVPAAERIARLIPALTASPSARGTPLNQ
jgi:hypothetical protein